MSIINIVNCPHHSTSKSKHKAVPHPVECSLVVLEDQMLHRVVVSGEMRVGATMMVSRDVGIVDEDLFEVTNYFTPSQININSPEKTLDDLFDLLLNYFAYLKANKKFDLFLLDPIYFLRNSLFCFYRDGELLIVKVNRHSSLNVKKRGDINKYIGPILKEFYYKVSTTKQPPCGLKCKLTKSEHRFVNYQKDLHEYICK